jgi:hypothetical protein
MPMKTSTWRSRHPFLLGTATSAAAVALIAVGLPAAALATHPASQARPNQIGPGYPPPGGIYTPFTNCPLLNPLMQETPTVPRPLVNGLSLAACTAGNVTSGSITIGNITTPVVRPVNVQFGFWTPPNASSGGDNDGPNLVDGYQGGILPPPAGLSAMLVTKPDLIPQKLTTALGCSTTTDPVVKSVCTQAENFGGKYQDVYALAQSAGQITNFGVLTWTQRIKFKLINPLLGSNCYIGSDNNPVVINPQLSVGPGGQLQELTDPNPTAHPDTFTLGITVASATDNTFTAPGVTGCGPGGAKNVSIDTALDAGTGLPAASGVNSLTLNGSFDIAATSAGENMPANNAKILLSAFKASVGTPAGPRAGVRTITGAQLHRALRRLGLR